MRPAASSTTLANRRPDTIHVVQGKHAVSSSPEARLCTLLGSCVAACMRDPVARVGGINHFLLPERREGSASMSYGVNAMELLINELLQRGARRDRLEAKLFGGARIVRGLSDVGSQNAEFAVRFLADEGIANAGSSLGGTLARRIEYWPYSGRARLQMIERAEEVFEVETRAPQPASVEDEVELF